MSSERKNTRTSRADQPGAVVNVPLWKKLLFAIITIAALFTVVEILLAVVGVRPALYEEDPYVGFSSYIPLFVEQTGSDGKAVMVTARNKLSFFNPQQFAATKSAGTYRIFCAGGSTTFGRPYDDMTSFCGWLRAMLPKADPSRKWEVINVGGVSYASYRVAVLMEELIRYEPDLFIIYSGHNEFLEHRTYGQVIRTPKAVRGLGAIMSRTRMYTVAKQALDVMAGSPDAALDKRDFLSGEVETILENSIGPESYHRDDGLKKQVLDHYRYNLMRMVDIARSVGAEVILITPASNLRHCSPFKSEHRTGLTGAQRNNWQMQFELASKAYAAAKWHEVLPAIDKAITIDRRYAHAHYLRGRALWELEHYDEAKTAFVRAMDEDVCALRAPTPILDIVKEVADKRNVPMVDFVALIEKQSEHAAPGEEQFLDHVHPTIEGNRRLALALLMAMGRQEIVHFASDWSDVLVEQITQEVESRLDVEAHGIALRNLSRLFRWAGKFEQGHTLGLRAVKMIPTDAEAHLVAGANAVELGLIDEAMRHYRQAIQIKPDYAKAHGKLGDAMLKRGRFDEAINQYRQALDADPNYSHAHSNLGVAISAKGELDEAIGHFHQALLIDPDHVETHNSLGSVLVAQGRSDEAIKHFSHAIEVNPRHFHARSNLASVLRLQGRFDEAISHFQQILQIKPDYVYAFNGLGLILQTRGKLDEAIDYYQQALEIEPDYAEAHGNLGDVLSGQGKLDEAISHYRQAVLADPNYAHAHCNLGVVISAKGELDQAEIHFRQALQIDPHYTEAHNNLASLLLAQGKLDEAINHYRRALQTRPGYARAQQGSDARRKSPVRLDNGASRYSQALRARPDYARVHHNLGRALTKAGEFVGALEHFRHAASLKPNWPTPLNDAARILATHSDPNVQDASRAVDFAERAAKLTEYRNVSVLDTLATAYAAAGQFDKAVDTIETAIVLASAANADNRVGHLRRRLGLYRQGKL